MGNLFSRQVQPSEIEGMKYSSLKYWNRWHEIMEKAEEAEAETIKNGVK